MNRNTHYSDGNGFQIPKWAQIIAVIIFFAIPICLVIAIFKTSLSFRFFPIALLVIYVGLSLFMYVGSLFGFIGGKSVIKKEDNSIKKDNPYLYLRELPNNYGIGVTTLLFDSTIENYKDIIAIILDLCAKKYLSLNKNGDKYFIKVLKSIDDNLLKNEKYILELIINKEISHIDYNKWFNYCLEDGNDLGVYFHEEKKSEDVNYQDKYKEKLKKLLFKWPLKTAFIFSLIVLGVTLFNSLSGSVSDSSESVKLIISSLGMSVGVFFTIWIVCIILSFIISPFFAAANGLSMAYKTTKKVQYDVTLNNHLTRTQKGVDEYQKLLSFRNFLADFGRFVDKNPEEVMLWDRYLSYAQVFGLAKDIMKTGYKKLIVNSSFQIDDIDNITIDSLVLENDSNQ